jgi:Histidine kinase
MDDGRTGTGFNAREIHDFWPRLLASPILGALVVNLSGLIDNTRHSPAVLVASYTWFALVAFLIWEGNRRLYFRLPRPEDWLLRPWSRLGLLLGLISLYTIPIAATLLWIWREATGDPGTRQYALTTALFAVVALVIAITHIYETVFLLRDWESARVRSALMEQARLQTELESLGREVDPHFLFNNLNALAHLVDQRSDAAPWFIRTLSATYRYVLGCRGRPLVPLADELEALERHRTLADVRYRGSVRLHVEVHPADARGLMLPPVSLSELFQNALKHNSVAPDVQLVIRVRIDGTTLVFENDLRSGQMPTCSTGIGLANLRERFRIATGRAADWAVEADRFVVRLPLVRSSNAAPVPTDRSAGEDGRGQS